MRLPLFLASLAMLALLLPCRVAAAVPTSGGGFPDYYLALEFVEPATDAVPPPAAVPTPTDAEIQRAFKRRALQFHPDKNSSAGAASMFRLLAEARATLLHHEYKRQEYDDAYQQYLEYQARQWMEQLRRNKASGGHSTQRVGEAESAALVFVSSFTPATVNMDAAAAEVMKQKGRGTPRASEVEVEVEVEVEDEVEEIEVEVDEPQRTASPTPSTKASTARSPAGTVESASEADGAAAAAARTARAETAPSTPAEGGYSYLTVGLASALAGFALVCCLRQAESPSAVTPARKGFWDVRHPHELVFRPALGKRRCDVCARIQEGWIYGCSTGCDFDVCSACFK